MRFGTIHADSCRTFWKSNIHTYTIRVDTGRRRKVADELWRRQAVTGFGRSESPRKDGDKMVAQGKKGITLGDIMRGLGRLGNQDGLDEDMRGRDGMQMQSRINRTPWPWERKDGDWKYHLDSNKSRKNIEKKIRARKRRESKTLQDVKKCIFGTQARMDCAESKVSQRKSQLGPPHTTARSEYTVDTWDDGQIVTLTSVLPWLYITKGSIHETLLTQVAGMKALEEIHVVDLDKLVGSKGLGGDVVWMGVTELPSPAMSAAAILNRLKYRVGGKENTCAILSYTDDTANVLLQSLSLYFHLYCGMDQWKARLFAARALGLPTPPVSIIDAGIQECAACGQGWLQRVIVSWPYEARSAKVAGDLVGGWHMSMPLVRDTSQKVDGGWRLQLWGLPPGVFPYKFVIDGEWCVDLSAPSTIDEWGNANNVITVMACGVDKEIRMMTMEDADGMAASKGGRESLFFLDDHDVFSQISQNHADMLLNPIDTEQRLRLARFGARILSYYKKHEHQ